MFAAVEHDERRSADMTAQVTDTEQRRLGGVPSAHRAATIPTDPHVWRGAQRSLD